MLRNFSSVVVISACIAGCATKPVEVDNTPLNPTAVFEKQVINNGIKGFFPYESTERDYVRANMRRDESTFKGTGTYSGFLIGTRAGTKIARIDRDKLWSLNTEKEEYAECPLKGCAESSKQPNVEPGDAAKKSPEAEHEPDCAMHISHTNYSVKETGQKKNINGFDTDEYQVSWVITLSDKAARKMTSTLNIDIWTTPLTQSMRDALGMEDKYARSFAGTVADTAKPKILPADAAKMMSSYLAKVLSPGDRDTFLDGGKQMEKVKGYPISTHLTWNMEGNACESEKPNGKEERKSSRNTSVPSSASGLASGLIGMLAERKSDDVAKETKNEPMLSFTTEVKSLKVEPVHDSLFTVPKDYRKVPKL
jgi:hypothetical protein